MAKLKPRLSKQIKAITKLRNDPTIGGSCIGRFPHIYEIVVSTTWGFEYAYRSFFHEVGHSIDLLYKPQTGDSEKFADAFSWFITKKPNETLKDFWICGNHYQNNLLRWRNYGQVLQHNRPWREIVDAAESKLQEYHEDILKLIDWIEEDPKWRF